MVQLLTSIVGHEIPNSPEPGHYPLNLPELISLLIIIVGFILTVHFFNSKKVITVFTVFFTFVDARHLVTVFAVLVVVMMAAVM